MLTVAKQRELSAKRRDAQASFQATDDAWSKELTRLFGREAGDVRYMKVGRGDPGSELRKLYDARETARRTWELLSF